MSQISSKLRLLEGQQLMYWCQGCNSPHSISYAPGGWTYNGNPEAPTFSPSVLCHPHKTLSAAGKVSHAKWVADGCQQPLPEFDTEMTPLCHTFITDGMVQFLGDCQHQYAGQTLPLPELPDYLRDDES